MHKTKAASSAIGAARVGGGRENDTALRNSTLMRVDCADYLIALRMSVSSEFSPDHRLSAPIDLGRVRNLFHEPDRVVESVFFCLEITARMHDILSVSHL